MFIVYRKELTDMLRDRRTIFAMVVFPLVIFPLMSVGINQLAEKSVRKVRQEASPIMLLGAEHAPELAAKLANTEGIQIVPAAEDYKQQINDKKIRLALQFPPGFEASLKGEAKEPPKLTLYYYVAEIRSEAAAGRVEDALRAYRDEVVASRLTSRTLSPAILKPVETKRENVAAAERVGAERLSAILSYFLVILCLSGASHPAMDLTAGEKERGTMETILASAVGRRELVLGKFLLVLTTSLVTAIFALTSFGLSMRLAPSYLKDVTRGYGFTVSAPAILSVFILVLPLAIFFAAALVTLSVFAKSYKEAQSYLGPLMFGAIMPAVIGMLPGIELGPALALVPVLNVSLTIREVLTGHFPWGLMTLVFASTAAYGAAAISTAITLFQREDVLFRT